MMMQPIDAEMMKSIEVQRRLTEVRIETWMREDLFHFRWWFLIVLFIISVFAWWKTVDKHRLPEILLYTAIITLFALTLDELGEELSLWEYPTDIIPLFPPLSAIDLASLPLFYSLIYQYFRSWKAFIVATVIMAAVFCFVFEPLITWGGIYLPLTWRYYYGFPIYIALAVFTKAVVIKLYKIASRYKRNGMKG